MWIDDRGSSEYMQKDGVLKTIWRVLYPYIVYFAITVVIEILLIIPDCIRMIQNAQTSDRSQMFQELNQLIYDKAMFLTFVSGLITIPVLYLFFFLDKKKYRDKHLVISYVPLPLRSYLYTALLGIFACLSLNNLIDLTGIINYSPMYQELANKAFGGDIYITFLTTIGMAPILEELLFRGLIYKRLRNICKPFVAAIISSLAFGITHGNLVQFLYAFFAGMLMAYVYEKYKNIWAPIIFHLFANILSMLGAGFIDGVHFIWIKVALLVLEAAVLFVIYKIIDYKVNREIKPIISELQVL